MWSKCTQAGGNITRPSLLRGGSLSQYTYLPTRTCSLLSKIVMTIHSALKAQFNTVVNTLQCVIVCIALHVHLCPGLTVDVHAWSSSVALHKMASVGRIYTTLPHVATLVRKLACSCSVASRKAKPTTSCAKMAQSRPGKHAYSVTYRSRTQNISPMHYHTLSKHRTVIYIDEGPTHQQTHSSDRTNQLRHSNVWQACGT